MYPFAEGGPYQIIEKIFFFPPWGSQSFSPGSQSIEPCQTVVNVALACAQVIFFGGKPFYKMVVHNVHNPVVNIPPGNPQLTSVVR